jgi:glucose-1-phosphate cytidylyltransferase
MKTVILAGGLGTRLSEETSIKPKPMVEIGGYPILWHIMKYYAHFGYTDFIIALGYKGEYIKDYFLDYSKLKNDFTIDLKTGTITNHNERFENWKITLVETGKDSQTGERIRQLKDYVDKTFMLTYGDGLSNVDIFSLLKLHYSELKYATVTGARPPARFGHLKIEGNSVVGFNEKTQTDSGWINAGFFVLDKKIFDYIPEENVPWEDKPLQQLTKDGQLACYKHEGFFQPMDTLREKSILESLWENKLAPWKVWNE